MEALKVLQNSATIQALLKQETQKTEASKRRWTRSSEKLRIHISLDQVVVKQEQIEASLDPIPTVPIETPRGPKRLKITRDRYASSISRDVSGTTSPSGYKDTNGPNLPTANPESMPPKNLSTSTTEGFHRPLPTAPSAMTSAKPTLQRQGSQEVNLTRELWDVRRQITALKAQEDILIEQLRKVNPAAVPQDVKTKENEQAVLGMSLAHRDYRRWF